MRQYYGWFSRSSPPARGSSPFAAGEFGSEEVVPASAGIVRTAPASPGFGERRPRQRGDRPPPRRGLPGAALSSPPARGSSPNVSACRAAWSLSRVVPASAGIVLVRVWPELGAGRRPRQRGDRPSRATFRAACSVSSPPARGSFVIPDEETEKTMVVPASAGIVRHNHGSPGHRRRRPRQRGDRPTVCSALDRKPESSPQRGDRPHSGRLPTTSTTSSPPARGSSGEHAAVGDDNLVVPASAGIVPSATHCPMHSPCRPRQRGDRPRPVGEPAWVATSSPPARGSSTRRTGTGTRGHVVPASAGIVPTERGRYCPAWCRPRQRARPVSSRRLAAAA